MVIGLLTKLLTSLASQAISSLFTINIHKRGPVRGCPNVAIAILNFKHGYVAF